MGKVKGEDVILYMQEQDGISCSDPIACGRSITFNIDQDMIETSITGNGRFRTYVPGAAKVTANIEGLVNILHTEQITVTGEITYSSSNSVIFTPEIDCIKTGTTVIIDGGGIFDNAPYNLFAFVNVSGSSTLVFDSGTIPFFTSFTGTITYTRYLFTIDRMYDAITSGSLINFDFYETDDEGHYLKKTFEGYINSLSEVASFDNIVTFSADITANGLPTITYGTI